MFSPPDTPITAMGSGFYPSKNTKYDAYFRLTSILNVGGEFVDASNTETFTNKRTSYDVIDVPRSGGQFRHLVLYGGPASLISSPIWGSWCAHLIF